jgi:hypothetical protein
VEDGSAVTTDFAKFSAPIDVDLTAGRQDAECDPVGPGGNQGLRITKHDLELTVGVRESTGPRADHRDQRGRDPTTHFGEQAGRRRQTAKGQSRIQFQPIGPGPNCREGVIHGGDADLK